MLVWVFTVRTTSVDDGADQLLALADGSGRGIEDRAHVRAGGADPGDLGVSERDGAAGLLAAARSFPAARTAASLSSRARSRVRATSRFSGSTASNWRSARSAS